MLTIVTGSTKPKPVVNRLVKNIVVGTLFRAHIYDADIRRIYLRTYDRVVCVSDPHDTYSSEVEFKTIEELDGELTVWPK